MKTTPFVLTALLLAAAPLRAQLVADGATNTLSNVTNFFTSDVTVGTNGSFTLLVLSDNTLVTNRGNVIIGRNTTAKSNEVRLISSSARWLMGGLFVFPTVYLGSNGAFNRLVVSNGGAMRGAFASYIGTQVSASNNLALVTGPGSVWGTATLTLGSSGAGNQVIVSDGGVLECASSLIGLASSNNLAVVTGSGSTWTNENNLTVGLFGAGNQLLVSEGGAVHNARGLLGSDSAGSNTVALITGAGSVWNNRSDLSVGEGSAGNQMEVNSGGRVVSSNTYVGNLGGRNFALITGTGSLLSNRADLYVGYSSSANQLVVTNGALVVNSNGLIGRSSSAHSNSVTVTDPGTKWLIASDLYVGSNGSFNRLIVGNGGLVTNRDTYVGFDFPSSNNAIIVTGSGSALSNGNHAGFFLGHSSEGNQLVVSNGGLVHLPYAEIGSGSSSISNEAVITGTGSLLDVGLFVVGNQGRGSRMVVSNGGSVNDSYAFIGENVSGRNNDLLVTGAGSTWTSLGILTVGFNSQGNQLVITNGGQVLGGISTLAADAEIGVIVGDQPPSTNNRVVVDGGTLRTTNALGTGTLEIRRGTNILNAGLVEADLLLLTNGLSRFEFNGGTLVTRGAFISNGLAFAVGASGATPAVWDVRAGTSNHFLANDLLVGQNTSFNQLLVTNGALLRNAFGVLGVNASSRSNVALLMGSGSVWSNANDLYVGRFGSGNQLMVSNGALVRNNDGYLGVSTGSSNNLVVVTSPGSVWSNAGSLFLGQDDQGNRLVVTNGGVVRSGSAFVGAFSGSSNNQALVSGSGSEWSNTLDLYVGLSGAGNQLVVSNSAVVSVSGSAFLGNNSSSTNNRMVVDGGTLRATNVSATGLLDIRRGTNVLNAGLIEADIVRMTNSPRSVLVFNGGTLSARSSRIASSTILLLGNGISPATMILAGNGVHDFSGNLVVRVSSNAVLTGNGTVSGLIQIQSGGTLIPGLSVGKMIFSNTLTLHGVVVMEISKNGAVLTNDQIQAAGTLTYGGSLTVSNLGPTALAIGNRFRMFDATNYAGLFSGLNLPNPGPGLNWTNRLLVDGSIEVVPWNGPKIGSVTLSGTNLIFSVTDGFPGGAYDVQTATNVTASLPDWTVLSSGTFDWLGNTTVTNGIDPGEPQRYFRLRIP